MIKHLFSILVVDGIILSVYLSHFRLFLKQGRLNEITESFLSINNEQIKDDQQISFDFFFQSISQNSLT